MKTQKKKERKKERDRHREMGDDAIRVLDYRLFVRRIGDDIQKGGTFEVFLILGGICLTTWGSYDKDFYCTTNEWYITGLRITSITSFCFTMLGSILLKNLIHIQDHRYDSWASLISLMYTCVVFMTLGFSLLIVFSESCVETDLIKIGSYFLHSGFILGIVISSMSTTFKRTLPNELDGECPSILV